MRMRWRFLLMLSIHAASNQTLVAARIGKTERAELMKDPNDTGTVDALDATRRLAAGPEHLTPHRTICFVG